MSLDLFVELARISLGAFFSISGYHKLFHAGRHESLVVTLIQDGIPAPRLNAWLVSGTELLAGALMLIGLAVPVAAAALLAICFVACLTDAPKRVSEMHPIDFADTVDDWLYLSEVWLILVLAIVIAAWPGPFTIDAILVGR